MINGNEHYPHNRKHAHQRNDRLPAVEMHRHRDIGLSQNTEGREYVRAGNSTRV
jgi:hypothetical protein